MSSAFRGFALFNLVVAILQCFVAWEATFAERPYQIVWGRRIGTPRHDIGHAVAVDTHGNLFLAWTHATPPIDENSLHYDTSVNRYDFDGNLIWEQTYDSAISDLAYDIAIDNLGNAYVAGVTAVAEDEQLSSGYSDGFIRKVAANGATLWERRFGTDGNDEVNSIVVSPLGDVFVSGQTNGSLDAQNAGGNDAYVGKFDTNGNQLWFKQFGTHLAEGAWAVSADRLGNVFITGTTFGVIGTEAFGSADTFTIKLDNEGNTLWIRQWGSAIYDQGYAVQADGDGGAYIAGYGMGAFVARYDSDGDLLWVEHLNSGKDDWASNVVLDDHGNVYVAGSTRGSLGDQSFGGIDSFVSKFTPDGNLLWVTQFGSEADDGISGMAIDDERNIYVSGLTWGSLAAPHFGGGGDAFLIKLSAPNVPEPNSVVPLLLFICCYVCFRRTVM